MYLFKRVIRGIIIIIGILIGFSLGIMNLNQYEHEILLRGEKVENFTKSELETIVAEDPDSMTFRVFVNIPFIGGFWTQNVKLGNFLHFGISILILSAFIFIFWQLRKLIPLGQENYTSEQPK